MEHNHLMLSDLRKQTQALAAARDHHFGRNARSATVTGSRATHSDRSCDRWVAAELRGW